MATEIRPLKPMSNASMMDAIRNDASLDYQRRIPSATIAGVQETVKTLQQFKPLWNEFIDALVNRIGSVVVRNMSWSNPLGMFKQGMLNYGSTIEEIKVGLLEAHIYDPDREYMERDLFGTERPWVESNFHSVNRENFYKITINEALLRRAFLEAGGLSNFVSELMSVPHTSDQVDEFLLTLSLFPEYEANPNGGFYHVNIPNLNDWSSTEADAKAALRKVRAMAGELKFPSTKYNAAHMPTWADEGDLILLATPAFQAAIDVDALAGAFNIDRANVSGKIVTIPNGGFGIDGAQAILTVPDFFVIADTVLENNSQFNPAGLSHNYFLHHHQIISCSRFVPAVMYWTGPDDEVVIVSGTITGISAVTLEGGAALPESVNRGAVLALSASGVGDAANKGVAWHLSGNESNRTYITDYGVLHVDVDETAPELTVIAHTTWVNPANPDAEKFERVVTLPIAGNEPDPIIP